MLHKCRLQVLRCLRCSLGLHFRASKLSPYSVVLRVLSHRRPGWRRRHRPDKATAAGLQRCADEKRRLMGWEQHLADGFIAGKQLGRSWQTQDEFIKDLQGNKNKWKSGNISEVKVAAFGPIIAVSHYTFTYDAELQGWPETPTRLARIRRDGNKTGEKTHSHGSK